MFVKPVICLAFAVVLAATSMSFAGTRCPTPAAAPANVAQLLDMINRERHKAGLAAVALSAPATKVAQAYACETQARHDIGHIGNDGSNVADRLARAGVGVSVVAENNATGFTTAAKTMAAWMSSAGHRSNILTPEVTRIGIGQAEGGYPTWVLILYAPG